MRQHALVAMGLLAVVGCKKDADNDGFSSLVDCNDDAPTVYPGAAETCNGVDNDCDGVVDDGVQTTYFSDGDGDTYGDPDVTSAACEQPEGFVENSLDCDDSSDLYHPGAAENDCEDPADYNCDGSVGYDDADGDGAAACMDCDDSDPNVFPDNVETCDGVDNNCNGLVDVAAEDAPLWSIDFDGDGYGAADSQFAQQACEQPEGYVAEAGDCDDTDDSVYPGAEEACDGIDSDCDGEIDSADDPDAEPWYLDVDDDGYGSSDELVYSCEPLQGYAVDDGDCEPEDDTIHPGAVDVCNDGIDSDCAPNGACQFDLALSPYILTGEMAGDGAGHSQATLGDVDGDGETDFAVGARFYDDDGDGAAEGAVYVMLGPLSGTGGDLGQAHIKLVGSEGEDHAGYAITGLADVDGDNASEILVSAPTAEAGSSESTGLIYVFLSTGLTTGSLTMDDASAFWEGDNQYEYAGGSMTQVGDFTGNGLADFVVGATSQDTGGNSAGGVYLVQGEADWSGSLDLIDSAVLFTGEEAGDKAGNSAAGVGDLDGDGSVDLVMGARLTAVSGEESGAVYIATSSYSGITNMGDVDVRLHGVTSGDRAGQDVASAGDQNGDGYWDVLVGAPLQDGGGSDAGAAYVVYGALSLADLDGSDLEVASTAVIYGTELEGTLGNSVAGDGDFDGDGTADLLMAAQNVGEHEEGAVYLVYGPASGQLTVAEGAAALVGDEADDHVGTSVGFFLGAGAGGVDAVVVGAREDDTSDVDAGSLFVVSELAP